MSLSQCSEAYIAHVSNIQNSYDVQVEILNTEILRIVFNRCTFLFFSLSENYLYWTVLSLRFPLPSFKTYCSIYRIKECQLREKSYGKFDINLMEKDVNTRLNNQLTKTILEICRKYCLIACLKFSLRRRHIKEKCFNFDFIWTALPVKEWVFFSLQNVKLAFTHVI